MTHYELWQPVTLRSCKNRPETAFLRIDLVFSGSFWAFFARVEGLAVCFKFSMMDFVAFVSLLLFVFIGKGWF